MMVSVNQCSWLFDDLSNARGELTEDVLTGFLGAFINWLKANLKLPELRLQGETFLAASNVSELTAIPTPLISHITTLVLALDEATFHDALKSRKNNWKLENCS